MSSKREIVEGDKLIAEFMELNHIHPYLLSSKPFNTSWDWLMRVVDKIESLGYMHCVEKINEIQHRSFFNELKMVNEVANGARSEKKLEAVWLSVIDFIKWHNENGKGI